MMTHFSKTLIAAAFMASAATPALAQVAAPDTSPKCAPINISVYFAADQADLSSAAQTALAAQATGAPGCIVSTIEAEAISTDGDSALSQARSTSVLLALADLGIATADTQVQILAGPDTNEGRLINTARRVDVTLNTLPSLINS